MKELFGGDNVARGAVRRPEGRRSPAFRRLALPLLISLTVVGCAAKRDFYDVPDVPLPARFRSAPDLPLPASIDSRRLAEGMRLQQLHERLLGLTLSTDVLFDFDKSEIKEGARPALAELVDLLNGYEKTLVRVVGHTDAHGSVEYNQGLSERRAAAVVESLVAAGVERGRLTAVGMSELAPRATNETDEGRRLNRRVEVKPPPAPPEPDRSAMALESVLTGWWRLLGDPRLDDLVDRALAGNHELRIAGLRAVQARARADQKHADKWPVFTAPMQAKGEAPEEGIGDLNPGDEIKTRHTYMASLRADWRPDLWGELASAAEVADMEVWRSAFLRDDTQRRLVARVVSTYVEYLSLNDRVRVARETEQVLRGMLEAMESRLEKGDATVTDVEQQRAAVHAVEATIPALELEREQLFNRMALLVGGVPTGLVLPEVGLDALALPRVFTGVPSYLIFRRPDVRAVEAALIGADADIDLARARVLPPLDLTAQIGYGSRYLSHLFDPHTLFWNAIANLSITLWDKGKRYREVHYARAVHEEMVEEYVRTIYNGVVEVEDALVSIELTGRRLEIQQRATRAARRAWELSRESYDAGAIDYLALLDTERTYHRNLDESHQIRMERYRALVELFGALGGGVEGREPIPGEGKRPLPAPWERNGVVVADEPTAPLVAGWSGPPKGWGDELFWLVELPGVHDQAGVDATWRDLVARYGEGIAAHRLLLLPHEHEPMAPDTDQPRGEWYRLFITEFDAPEAADRVCERLQAHHQRCRVVTSRLIDSSDAVLEWELVEGAILSELPPPSAGMAEKADVAPPAAVGSPVDSPATPGMERYAVQVGSFGEPRNAERAVAAWRAKGYDARLHRVESAEEAVWHTVRIGAYASREEAAAAAAELRGRERVEAVTVQTRRAVPGASAPESAPEADASEGEVWIFDRRAYAVQLGTFGRPDNAAALARTWRAKGYAAYVSRLAPEGGEVWFTVRVGPYESPEQAVAAAREVAEREGANVLVVPAAVDAGGEPRALDVGRSG